LLNNIESRHEGPTPIIFLDGYIHENKIVLEYRAAYRWGVGDNNPNRIWYATAIFQDGDYHIKNWRINKLALDRTALEGYNRMLIETDYGIPKGSKGAKDQAERMENALAQNKYILFDRGSGNIEVITNSYFPNTKNRRYYFFSQLEIMEKEPLSTSDYLLLIISWPVAVIIDYISIVVFMILTKGVRIDG